MAKEEKDRVIKLSDKVTIWGTGKSKRLPEGKIAKVHPELAKNLIAAGKASETEVKPKEK